MYHFLKWPHRRAITVGATIIWVWDKDEATLAAVRRLVAWEAEHMISTMRELFARPGDVVEKYQLAALTAIGLRWPARLEDWLTDWKALVEQGLGFRVTLFGRAAG